MIKWFEELFEHIKTDESNDKNTQTIVVKSLKGNIYKFINNITSKDDELEFLNFLVSKNDTQISGIICAWSSGEIDLPSFAFRKSLCELNANNKDAKIILKNLNGYNCRKISETF